MVKAKIILSIVSVVAAFAGVLAFKSQKKFLGRYFCTTVTCATLKFNTVYTTLVPIVTLYCTREPAVSACTTFKVRVNA